MNKDRVINKAEDLADQFLRLSKHWLPHLARLCIVSTFIEDGLRMWMQWDSQRDYMARSWGIHWSLGSAFVFFNLIGQLGGSAVVLTRKFVNVGIGVLFSTVIVQTFAYEIFTEIRFLLKNLALVGGLVLLLAEEKAQGKSLFAGLPSMGEKSSKTYLQLGGRLMLVLMFLTLLRFTVSPFSIIVDVIGGSLTLLLAIGYKTKLASLVLVCLLTSLNFYFNNWWQYSPEVTMRDFLKYDFFQMLSVIGGLLLVISLGPGDATTTICHRHTPHDDLKRATLNADIIIVATGTPNLIRGDMVSNGCVVIDVGVNEVFDAVTGKFHLVGDVNFEEVSQKASFITPVPGGVGPLTVAMLMKNTLKVAKREVVYDHCWGVDHLNPHSFHPSTHIKFHSSVDETSSSSTKPISESKSSNNSSPKNGSHSAVSPKCHKLS